VLGKQKRVSFSKAGRELKTEKLDLVHSDVWGPAPVQSFGGSRYYVTFIDDSTRKVWVYFIKHKSDVFNVFKRWKAEVETETGLKLKCLKSDNGGEYDSAEFKAFCADHGIKQIRTVPNRPQQNGVAERMNQTLNERARAMRLHAGLPKMFWADAVNTAAYLINRTPMKPLNLELPEEKWKGKKISLNHLRIFGSISYVHIDADKRDKLDAKAQKCVFIGYGSNYFGYRFWVEQNRKIIRSRDATFNENELYKDRFGSIRESESKGRVNQNSAAGEVLRESEVVEFSVGESTENENETVTETVVDQSPETPVVRKSNRTIKPPSRYSPSIHYLMLTDAGEPENYHEAVETGDSVKWEGAMRDEIESLRKNKTWVLTRLPDGKKALQNKWVYRVKDEPDGSKRYKARLVVKGFLQKEGVDYTEVFSPVVKLTTIRTVLSIVAAEDLHLEQMDVKTAFLHGDLEEDIYMVQPEGFETPGKEGLVCKLEKSLYGLKQAPRQWYMKFDKFMCDRGFQRGDTDHCCYYKNNGDTYIILLLYVDDMLITGANMSEINKLKKELSREFEMKDLGAANQILGMRITRDRAAGTLTLSQEKYIKKVLERFRVDDAKPRSTPLGAHFKLSKGQSPKTTEEKQQMARVPYASAVGSLMYAMVCTRPDIAHAVGVVSRFMANPGIEHWEAIKWLLRYLKGTSNMALCYKRNGTILQGFVDADLGGDVDSRKSTSGYVFTMGGTAVSWMSRLQKCVALSTTEAEYVAISEAGKEMVWLLTFLKEIGKDQRCRALYTDSQSALCLAKNPVFHSRTKHIQLKYHYIRELVKDGTISLEKIQGTKNPADMLTKEVPIDKLRLCAASVGLVE